MVVASVGSNLGDVVVRDTDDHPVKLATLWAEHAVVLAFVRHFG